MSRSSVAEDPSALPGQAPGSRRRVPSLQPQEQQSETLDPLQAAWAELQARQAELEERQRFVLETVGIGAWERDLQTGVLHWSRNLAALHGLTPEQAPRTFDQFL